MRGKFISLIANQSKSFMVIDPKYAFGARLKPVFG